MKKLKISILFFLLFFILFIFFIPITNVSSNKEGEYRYCKYRLAVYEFNYYESDESPHSDTFFGNIIFTKKIGGIQEYFGLKKINQYQELNINSKREKKDSAYILNRWW